MSSLEVLNSGAAPLGATLVNSVWFSPFCRKRTFLILPKGYATPAFEAKRKEGSYYRARWGAH